MNLIAIGDNVVDCYLDQEKYYPGGNCVNVAVNAKRNGAANVAYIGIFATDDKAAHIKYALEMESVKHDLSRIAEGISGQPRVSLTEDGDREFVGGPKNTVQHRFKIQLTPEELDYISKFDICHVSCYSSMEGELEKLSKVIDVSYDFSDKADLNYIGSITEYIKFAFFSVSELTNGELQKFIEQVRGFKFEVAAFTRGNLPALFLKDGEIYEQKLQPVTVVDTMGAGDSLIAGFLVNYLNGKDIESAIEKGTESAAKTCSFYGGFGYPQVLE